MPPERRPPEEPAFPSPRERAALIAIVAVAALLRLWDLGRFSIWLDEAASREFTLYGFRHAIAAEMNHPPLYRIVLWLATRAIGESEFALRLPSALFSTLAVPAVHALARSLLLRTEIRLLAALLAAASPFEIFLGQEARAYPLVILLAALHLASFARLAGGARPAREWVVFAATGLLGLYGFYLFGLLLAGEFVAALLFGAPRVRPLLASLGTIALAFSPWAVKFALSVGTQERDYIGGLAARFFAWPFRTVVGPSLAVVNWPPPPDTAAFVLAHLPETLAFLVAVPGPLLLGFACLLREKGVRGKAVVVAWAATPALLAAGYAAMPLFHERYLSFLTPVFHVALATGLARLRTRFSRWTVTGLLAALVLLSLRNLYGEDTGYGREEWREAAAVVEAGRRPGDVVALHKPYVDIAWNYYYHPDEGEPEPVRLPAGRGTIGDLSPHSADVIARARRVWLVLAHTWDTGDAWRVEFARAFGEERREVILPLSHGIRLHLFERGGR